VDEADAKLAEIGEFCNTSGKRDAEIAIPIVGIPPVAVHALRIEITDVHEVAVRVQRRSLYAFPSSSGMTCPRNCEKKKSPYISMAKAKESE